MFYTYSPLCSASDCALHDLLVSRSWLECLHWVGSYDCVVPPPWIRGEEITGCAVSKDEKGSYILTSLRVIASNMARRRMPGFRLLLKVGSPSFASRYSNAHISSAVNVLRMVKLFGWETKMSQKLRKKRDDELKLLWKYKLLDLANGLLRSVCPYPLPSHRVILTTLYSYLIPTLTMLVTFSAYTMVFKQELRASVIFPSMSVFSLLREQMQRIFWETSMIIQGTCSLPLFTVLCI